MNIQSFSAVQVSGSNKIDLKRKHLHPTWVKLMHPFQMECALMPPLLLAVVMIAPLTGLMIFMMIA